MLRDKCYVNKNIGADTFVGIKCQNGNISVHFPLGFSLAKADDEAVRKDILLLIDVLSVHGKNKESEVAFVADERQQLDSPLYSYVYVIRDYVSRGYYKEGVVEYASAKRGKINWNRTIKQKKPVVQDNDIFYLDFITKKNVINENDLLTMIHQYCVYTSFEKIGWLFTDYKPPKPTIPFHREWFSTALMAKLRTTFNDSTKALFQNMLKIINSESDDGLDKPSYSYGTYHFEYVWEHMIDTVFGIKDKQKYFPQTQWQLVRKNEIYNNSALEPDTIMLYKNNIYVLDAKYYKYGATKVAGHLPNSASINKQITYAEYIVEQKHLQTEDTEIYNAFIMPFDKTLWEDEQAGSLHYIGEAVSSWKDNKNKYERIQGILLDVKHLMQIAEKRSESDIMAMAAIIEEHCR